MAVKFTSAVWSHAKYSGGELLVLLALADYANDQGECWPRVESIAAKARLGVRQVRNILRKLKSDGVLLIIPGGGRAIRSRYKLNMETVKPVSLNSISLNCISVKLPAETVQSSSEKQCNFEQRNKERIVSEPAIEPSAEICERCSNTGVRAVKGHPGTERYCWCSVGARLQQLEQSEAKWKPA